MISNAPAVSWIVSTVLVMFVATTYTFESVTLLFGGMVSAWIAAGSAAASALVAAAAVRGAPRAHRLALAIGVCVLLIIVLAASAWLAWRFDDVSSDGQEYHQSAVLLLADGWNPYARMVTDGDTIFAPWVNHFPIGSWTVEAALFLATGQIQVAKMINAMLACASCAMAFALLMPRYGRRTALGLSLLAGLNAVVLCQLTSFYLDGQVASVSLMLLCAVIGWVEEPNWLRASALVACVVYLTGLKYTGVLFAAVALTVPLVVLLTQSRRIPAMRFAKLSIFAALVAMLIAGLHPYVTNTIRMGNPFYLLIGEGAFSLALADEKTGCCVPPGFDGIDRGSGLALSLLSVSENNAGAAPLRRKIPLTIVPGELRDFFLPDVRIGGWGPLFGGALLISGIAAASGWRAVRPPSWAIGSFAGVIACVLALPYPWWARYAPMLAFVPVILIAALDTSTGRVVRILRWVAVSALTVNAALVGWSHFAQQVTATREIREQYMTLASIADPILLRVNETESVRHGLAVRGIHFLEVAMLPCVASPILYSTATYCVAPRR